MAEAFSVSIDEIVNFLALEKGPRFSAASSSYNVRCPWCGQDGRKYKLNVDRQKNAYHCVACGQGGGALDLYGRLRHGTPLIRGKAEDGGNGNTLFHALMEDLHRDFPCGKIHHEMQKETSSDVRVVLRASDEDLNHAYEALLDFPMFNLSAEHQENLKRRGLSDQDIQNNGYRTIPSDCSWISQWPEGIELFDELGLEDECRKYDRLRSLEREQLIAGFFVAEHLRFYGISMQGVPGFFCIQGTWLFRPEPGMLIPTRNREGKIVGLQARKDQGSLRYMTVSSKDLPEGVTEGISRTHFPLHNEELTPDTKVYVTEGPLKSDVALSLMHGSGYFIAIQGVNNQKELEDIFRDLYDQGIRTIWNALDMDKLTNPHVAAAGRKIRKLAQSAGLTMLLQCWDEHYAHEKHLELYLLCVQNRIPVYPLRNIFLEIDRMAEELNQCGIRHSVRVLPDGSTEKDYWLDATKGIDDYLLSIQEKP